MFSPGFWQNLKRDVLGDPVEAALAPRATSYEEVHGDVQGILIPPTFPKGITVHLTQSLNKHFALQHK